MKKYRFFLLAVVILTTFTVYVIGKTVWNCVQKHICCKCASSFLCVQIINQRTSIHVHTYMFHVPVESVCCCQNIRRYVGLSELLTRIGLKLSSEHTYFVFMVFSILLTFWTNWMSNYGMIKLGTAKQRRKFVVQFTSEDVWNFSTVWICRPDGCATALPFSSVQTKQTAATTSY